MKEPIYLIKGAKTTIEMVNVTAINGTTDLSKVILRGVVDVGDGNQIEFFIDNDKKYGCIYEMKEKEVVKVDLEEEGNVCVK